MRIHRLSDERCKLLLTKVIQECIMRKNEADYRGVYMTNESRIGEGDLFGNLKVLRKLPTLFHKGYYECLCHCGNTCAVHESKLFNGTQIDCGECPEEYLGRKKGYRGKQKLNLTGEKFGALTVLYEEPMEKESHYWHCQCSCGMEITVEQRYLRNGHITSCRTARHRKWLAEQKMEDAIKKRNN